MKLLYCISLALLIVLGAALMDVCLKPASMEAAQARVSKGVIARIELTMPWTTYNAWIRSGKTFELPAPLDED